jgi:hypothetical protein
MGFTGYTEAACAAWRLRERAATGAGSAMPFIF